MYLSAYKHGKSYAILWLLLATSPVAFGKKKSPAVQHKTDAHNAQLRKNNPPAWAAPATKTLTTAQQQWLSSAFKAKDSDKTRFKKLLGSIDHQRCSYTRSSVTNIVPVACNQPETS